MLWPQGQWGTLSSVSFVRRRLFYQYFRSLGDCLSIAPPLSLLLPYPQEYSYIGLALRQCWECKKERKQKYFLSHTYRPCPSKFFELEEIVSFGDLPVCIQWEFLFGVWNFIHGRVYTAFIWIWSRDWAISFCLLKGLLLLCF